MDPILSIELGAAHRADLLRTAELRRRGTDPVTRHPWRRARLAARVAELTTGLRPSTSRLRPGTARSSGTLCCA